MMGSHHGEHQKPERNKGVWVPWLANIKPSLRPFIGACIIGFVIGFCTMNKVPFVVVALMSFLVIIVAQKFFVKS